MGEQIITFQNFVKNIITNCEDLKKFTIYNMHSCPNLIQFVKEQYPQHLLYANVRHLSKTLPIKTVIISRLSDLAEFEYPHIIEYLEMTVRPNTPFANDWSDYQTLLSLCPNLKGIGLWFAKD